MKQAKLNTPLVTYPATPHLLEKNSFFLNNTWWWISAGRSSSLAQFSSSNHSVLIPSIVMLRVKTHRTKLCLQLLTQGLCLDSATALFSRWPWVTCPGSRSWTMLGTYWGIGRCGWSHARAWWMLDSNNQGLTDLQEAAKTQTSASFFTPGSS